MEGGHSRGDRMTTPAYLADLLAKLEDSDTVIAGMTAELKLMKKFNAEVREQLRALIDGTRAGTKEATKGRK